MGLLASFSIPIYLGLRFFQHPSIPYPSDKFWGIGFLLLYTVIFVLAQLRQRQWLVFGCISLFSILILVVSILSGNLISMLITIWLVGLSTAIGYRILQLLKLTSHERKIELVTLSTGLGLTALSILTLLLGALGILYPVVAYSVLAGLSVLFFKDFIPGIIPGVKQILAAVKEKLWTGNQKLEIMGISILLTGLSLSFVYSIAPAIYADEVVYRVAVPEIYAHEHRWMEVADTFASYYNRYPDLLNTLGLVLWDQPLPQFFSLTFGILVSALAFQLGLSIRSRRTAWFALIFLWTTPVFMQLTSIVYIDCALSFFVFGAIYAFTQWFLNDQLNYLILAGIFSGLAVGTKLNAAFFIFALFVFFSIYLIRRDGVRKWLIASSYLIIPALPFGLFWMVTDWIWTGNPIFPFMNAFFKSPRYSPINTFFHYGNFGMGKGWQDFIRLPWDLTVHTEEFSESFNGSLGALALLSLPWNYARRSSWDNTKRMLIYLWGGIIILSIIFWFFVAQDLRYLLPLLPLLAVLAALNLDLAWDDLAKHRWGKTLLYLGSFLFVLYAGIMQLGQVVSNWQIPTRYPIELAFGLQTRDEFLEARLPEYAPLQFLNTLGDGKHKVLSVGNDVRLYTNSHIISLYEYLQETNKVRGVIWATENWTWLDLYLALYQGGFEYVLVNQQGIRPINKDARFEEGLFSLDFISQFLDIEYADNGFIIFRVISPEEVSQKSDAVSENLLLNPGFEEFTGNNSLLAWYWYSTGQLDLRHKHTHSGKSAVLLNDSTPIYQEIEITAGDFYLLSAWTTANEEEDLIWLTINWLDEQRNSIDFEMWLGRVYDTYHQNMMISKAPPGAKYAHVVISVSPKNQVWIDDIEFSQVK